MAHLMLLDIAFFQMPQRIVFNRKLVKQTETYFKILVHTLPELFDKILRQTVSENVVFLAVPRVLRAVCSYQPQIIIGYFLGKVCNHLLNDL